MSSATSLSPATQKARERRITSTRAPAIVGCDRDNGPHWAARQILGIDVPHETTGPMERGVFLEDGITRWFVHRMKAQAQRTVEVVKPPFMVHREHRWLGDSIDGIVWEGGDIVGGVEAKNYLSDRWFEYGDPWSDEVDERTLIQCAVHMAVHNLPRVFVPLVRHDMDIYVVPRDAGIEEAVIFKCKQFWDEFIAPNLELVAKGAPASELRLPLADGTDGTSDWVKDTWRQSRGSMLEATEATRSIADRLKRAREEYEIARLEKERLSNEMRLAIGDAAGITFGEDGAVTWRANTKGIRTLRFDYKKGDRS